MSKATALKMLRPDKVSEEVVDFGISMLLAVCNVGASGQDGSVQTIVQTYVAQYPASVMCGNKLTRSRATENTQKLKAVAADQILSKGPTVIPEVIGMLTSSNQTIADLATFILIKYGAKAGRQLLTLTSKCTGKADRLAYSLATIFRSYEPNAQSVVVDELVRRTGLAKEFNWQVAALVAELRPHNMNPDPVGVALASNINLITKGLLDRSENVRQQALLMVTACAPNLSVPSARATSDYLAHTLTDSDRLVRQRSASAFYGLKSVSPAAAAALNNAIDDSDVTVADHAECAIVALSVTNKNFSPIGLLRGLKGDETRRLDTLRWIVHLGRSGAPLIPDLVKRYSSGTYSQSEMGSLMSVFREVGPPAYTAVPIIETQLSSNDESVLRGACQALEAIGPSAKRALPILLALERKRSMSDGTIFRAIRSVSGR